MTNHGMDHVSSVSFQAWRTPRPLGEALITEYDCVIDAAADADNALCARFFDGRRGSDGLSEPWYAPGRGVWCNPPYADVPSWLSKAAAEVDEGNCIRAVLLVPAAVGVSWFTLACALAEVHLFDERIRFALPPKESLHPDLQATLFKANGSPKTSPGGGNALIVIEEGGLRGVTGMRSSRTGALLQDFITGEVFGD